MPSQSDFQKFSSSSPSRGVISDKTTVTPQLAPLSPQLSIKAFTPQGAFAASAAASEGIDLAAGIEQWHPMDPNRVAIEMAMQSGDYSKLTPAQRAWIEYQTSLARGAIESEAEAIAQQALADQEAILSSIASQEAATQAAAWEEKQAQIAAQKVKQYLIYAAVLSAGGYMLYTLYNRGR